MHSDDGVTQEDLAPTEDLPQTEGQEEAEKAPDQGRETTCSPETKMRAELGQMKEKLECREVFEIARSPHGVLLTAVFYENGKVVGGKVLAETFAERVKARGLSVVQPENIEVLGEFLKESGQVMAQGAIREGVEATK